MLADPDDAFDVDFHSINGEYRLRLAVAPTGLATLCSVDDAHHVPGYPVCP